MDARSPGDRSAGGAGESAESIQRLRHSLGVLLLALGAAAVLIDAWGFRSQLDDAYISYRYALNLVEGVGLVFNPGEYVEGYTNLLWTLLVAGGIALGFEAPAVGHFLGLLSAVAVLVATYRYARATMSDSGKYAQTWIAAVPVWLLVANTSFIRWSFSGMETLLFAAAVTAALAAHARGRMVWTTAFACLATLTRPEGTLVAAVLLGFHLSSHWREGWRAWRYSVAYGLMLCVLTGFRLTYYGEFLPNTFYVKVSGIPIAFGIRYAFSFVQQIAIFLLLPAGIALWRERTVWPGGMLVALFLGYVISIGGDPFGHSRYLLAIVPCLAVIAVRGALSAYESNRLLGLAAAACIVCAAYWQVFGLPAWQSVLAGSLLLGAWAIYPSMHFRIKVAATGVIVSLLVYSLGYLPGGSDTSAPGFADSKRENLLRLAHENDFHAERLTMIRIRKLRERGNPVQLVAATGIGSFGYYSRLPILDILGLVDPTIARSVPKERSEGLALPGHARSNADYVLRRKPNYIFVAKKGSETSLKAHYDIWEHREFDRYYEWDPPMGYRRRPEN